MAMTFFKPALRGFWDDPWEGVTQPSRLFEQHFGGLIPEEFFRPVRSCCAAASQRNRQPPQCMPPQMSGVSEVVNTDQEFRVCVDVTHFLPDEINVKCRDNRVVIHGRHEERPDEHGFIQREFIRQYVLPKDVDPAKVTSVLNRDGILTLKAPKMALEAPKERVIPITRKSDDQ